MSTSPINAFLSSLIIKLVDCLDLLSPPWTWLLWALLREKLSLKPAALVVIKPVIISQPHLIWESHFFILFKNKISFFNQNNTLIYLQNQIALFLLTLPHRLFLPPQKNHFLFSGDDIDIYLHIQNASWLSLLSLTEVQDI